MVNMKIVAPPEMGPALGYSHGMRVGNLLFIAGQVGGDSTGNGRHKIVGGGLVAQFEKALENVVAIAKETGAMPEHIVEMTVYVTDMKDYRESRKELGEAWRRVMGRHYPAMTLVAVSELFEEDAMVEARAVVALHPDDVVRDASGEVC